MVDKLFTRMQPLTASLITSIEELDPKSAAISDAGVYVVLKDLVALVADLPARHMDLDEEVMDMVMTI